jgi:hypothetical protein
MSSAYSPRKKENQSQLKSANAIKESQHTILCSILVGSLKDTGKLIFVKSFPMLFFKTLHKLVFGL